MVDKRVTDRRTEVVHFATNRNLVNEAEGEFGDQYNADGPYCVRYGSAEIAVANGPMADEYEARSVHVTPELIPPRDAPPEVEERLGSTEIFSR